MPDPDLIEATELIRRAIAALDRAGGGADLAAAYLEHGIAMIDQLTAQPANGTPAAAD